LKVKMAILYCAHHDQGYNHRKNKMISVSLLTEKDALKIAGLSSVGNMWVLPYVDSLFMEMHTSMTRFMNDSA
jgi:hypothetical protein